MLHLSNATHAVNHFQNQMMTMLLLGFLSQPFWVLLTGDLMDTAGFATALTLLSVTYIAGIVIVSFIHDDRPGGGDRVLAQGTEAAPLSSSASIRPAG
jgi:hypothetical protein